MGPRLKTLWRIAYTVILVIAACGVAVAIDEGTVKGTCEINGKPVELKYAYAHMHDNAEKLLDRPRELRILLTDREVPRDVLQGLVFLPVEEMARESKVQGILFEMNPANPNDIVATALVKPSRPGQMLARTTHTVTGGKLFKKWSLDKQRVTGAIERTDKYDPEFPEITAASYSLEFSAPVFNEPAVTADLKGKAAVASPQVQALIVSARVMAKGDLAGVRKLMSDRSNRQFDEVMKLQGADAAKMAKQSAREMLKKASRVQHVVVRGDRAVVLFSRNEWVTLVREGGKWKVDL